ncbi:type II toxin-antitoxin system HicB family antitoxin [Endozoicomonas sp. 8E]|uniref:type II toxin-antitoxin system HicB family antitoxin n=1 Tax=Endozoicomonas sp. 8E TaxID=3035692 RepID=UPI0029393924|nr:type II toxin-antitoxin system HicB family antitoxin [Endozoicomonas sp. 8E]WOG25633.1 type II toxin-antitoxin system HicB family antitoxin [Endozoicomonas sp. 8E]
MLYPVAIEVGNDDYAFGAVVPDLKGCFSAGDSYEEALSNVVEAIGGHLELMAEEGQLPPQPSAIADLIATSEFSGWIWALVDVDNSKSFSGVLI